VPIVAVLDVETWAVDEELTVEDDVRLVEVEFVGNPEDEVEPELVEIMTVEPVEVDADDEDEAVPVAEVEVEILVEEVARDVEDVEYVLDVEEDDEVEEVEEVVVVVVELVTLKGAEAETPDAVARTVWTPVDADGTINEVVKAPRVLVAKLPITTLSKAIVPVASAVKFAPTTITLDPAGPEFGASTIVAEAEYVDAIEEERITNNVRRRSMEPTRVVLRSVRGLVARSCDPPFKRAVAICDFGYKTLVKKESAIRAFGGGTHQARLDPRMDLSPHQCRGQ
jgi:hypothetical protein